MNDYNQYLQLVIKTCAAIINNLFISAARKTYEDRYCRCTAKYNKAAWCFKWNRNYTLSFCVLGGGLKAKYCPGSWRVNIGGEVKDDYYSYHPSVCSRSISKYILK